MHIDVQYDALTADLYRNVRETAGFSRYPHADVVAALAGGLCSVVARVNDEVAGIGRLVGDGRIAFFIKDLVVVPKYRHNGVGTVMLDALVDYVRSHGCHHAYLGLMATPGKEGFYEEHGFTRRPTSDLGSGMVRFVDPR